MRIIGGEFKGVPIESPKGLDTRPTYDRVRESLASIIISHVSDGLDGKRVLDCFGGSGAVGFELLSRGASFALAFEKDKKSAQVIKANAKKLKLGKERYELVVKNIFEQGLSVLENSSHAPFDIVFLDPPYKTEASLISELLERFIENEIISRDCFIVYERESGRPSFESSSLELLKSKKYGNTYLDSFLLQDK